MKTGWSKRFHNEKEYRNRDENNVMHFPGFSKEAAEFLTKQRDIHGIGIDTLSLDAGFMTPRFEVHMIMLGRNRYQIENMYLENVPEYGAVVLSFPLNITKAPEAETRVIAFMQR